MNCGYTEHNSENSNFHYSASNEFRWTSLDIVGWTKTKHFDAKNEKKRHGNVTRDIEDEMSKLGDIGRTLFELASYNDLQGKVRPMYKLTDDGVVQLSARYDAVTRYTLIQKIKELNEQAKNRIAPENYIDALRALIVVEEAKEKLQIENKHLAETKAEISTKKAATAMNTASHFSKVNAKMKTRLDKFDNTKRRPGEYMAYELAAHFGIYSVEGKVHVAPINKILWKLDTDYDVQSNKSNKSHLYDGPYFREVLSFADTGYPIKDYYFTSKAFNYFSKNFIKLFVEADTVMYKGVECQYIDGGRRSFFILGEVVETRVII